MERERDLVWASKWAKVDERVASLASKLLAFAQYGVRELRGVLGEPSTEEEVVGPGWYGAGDACPHFTLASLRESYPIPKRHDAQRVLTELHEKRLELEASLPRVDRRVTREAEDQFQAAEAEWAKHSWRRQEREDQERSWTTRIRNKRPPQTRRLVVAQLETGDEIDDVRSPTRTILIGWLKRSDSPFREMRKAALRIPEVAALLAAPPSRVEHVDTTTVGTWHYLKDKAAPSPTWAIRMRKEPPSSGKAEDRTPSISFSKRRATRRPPPPTLGEMIDILRSKFPQGNFSTERPEAARVGAEIYSTDGSTNSGTPLFRADKWGDSRVAEELRAVVDDCLWFCEASNEGVIAIYERWWLESATSVCD